MNKIYIKKRKDLRRYMMSKGIKAFLPVIFFLACLLIPTKIVKAEDFTFQVPVELKNLHEDIGYVYVEVFVWSKKIKEGEGWPIADIASGRSEYFEITDGNYVGTVVIKLNAKMGKNPATAKTWRCILMLLNEFKRSLGNTCYVLRPDGPYPRDPSKPCKDWIFGYFK